MKKKALSYLPDDMKAVVTEFYTRLNRLRNLTKKCQFYYVGNFKSVDDKDKDVCAIEREWAHDLARSYTNADNIKVEMAKRFPMEVWQDIADDYDLPVSLVGYIAKHILTTRHKTPHALVKCLKAHYYMRMEAGAKKKQEREHKNQFKAIMYWKLGLGNFNKLLSGESPLPDKSKIATAGDWKTETMPVDQQDVTCLPVDFKISQNSMAIIRKGHIPEVQEDHWFMYCDEEYIRYFRSWTGMCAFEAHYKKTGEDYVIDNLKINHALAEFGVNGDEAGVALFCYLIITESGGDGEAAWQIYLKKWELLLRKYSE